MLEITDIYASLAKREVLHGISLTAKAGQVLAICGPNGAGKSTLLKAALGEIPARGDVKLNGQSTAKAKASDLARQRAVLPQDTQVAFAFTVAEIVAMGQEAGDFAAEPGLIEAALAAVGLANHATRPFQTLSGGERQRSHLARALAQVWQPIGPQGPRWLFLDEPVASLDLGHQLQVMRLARAYADQGGGVVAVMHDLNLSAMFADRMAFIIDGRLAAEGTPAEVLTAPLLERAYGCKVAMNTAPQSGPWFLPQACDQA
ncbi:heme ABC transporter ATP-binding protein [Xinfangfangia sp. CPCC 101601]|uniref:Heme ABC transporter ATP-binding protein n=1 Tax=Pseudogemmobacter lacusdianii TaxID=3069608 RepID=A0ABU0W1Y5_9RHOB|nr:heme ABC transporter ATP-binding protein [Xinfangfangia sp. CPCC 101601]MDQ2067979.1 heme ABC transporter ATP-binding protein [Xinfangfangia sp. CPCC 101601]